MDNPTDFYKSLPKVELHRHLEGSLRLRIMLEIARSNGITVPVSTGPLSSLVQVQTSELHTYQNFLAKFNTLRMFYRSPEVIHRVIREAVEDAANDNVRYLEHGAQNPQGTHPGRGKGQFPAGSRTQSTGDAASERIGHLV